MARPIKSQGIDYFPLDVDTEHDDKLPMIIGEFGFKGEMLFIKLLAYIYKTEGYYIKWNEESQLKFANRVAYITGGAQVNLINEVVNRCVKWGLFNKSLYETLNVLTSVRIQETWVEATRKRKNRVIDGNYWIISAHNPEETQEKTEKVHKVNKSKVNKSKASYGAPDNYFDLNIKERKTFFKSILKHFEHQYGYEMMNEFYKYWSQDVGDGLMYFEVQNDFYPKIRLENWKRIGAKPVKEQTEENPDFQKLKYLYANKS